MLIELVYVYQQNIHMEVTELYVVLWNMQYDKKNNNAVYDQSHQVFQHMYVQNH